MSIQSQTYRCTAPTFRAAAKQAWTPGETVKVGFITLEAVEKVGSDYRLWNPKSGKQYTFTPHAGCTSGWF